MAATNAPAHYYTAEDKSGYINEIYEQQRRAQQAALEAAYDEQVSAFNNQAAQIPGLYRSAKNATSSDAEISRAGLNESFAASGLNTGAGGQARLSQNNVLQGNLSALDSGRAAKLADLETERAAAYSRYQLSIAQAIADNELQRARQLYNEAVRVDESYTKAGNYYSGGSGKSNSAAYSGSAVIGKAEPDNIINVKNYGRLSYEEAERLVESGHIVVAGRRANGDPILLPGSLKNIGKMTETPS